MSNFVTPVPLTGADQTVATGPSFYAGICVRETAGAAAQLRIFDNTANSGTLLDTIALVANESLSLDYPRARRAGLGIRVDILAGTVEGSVMVA
jgi:hypothetical protein